MTLDKTANGVHSFSFFTAQPLLLCAGSRVIKGDDRYISPSLTLNDFYEDHRSQNQKTTMFGGGEKLFLSIFFFHWKKSCFIL